MKIFVLSLLLIIFSLSALADAEIRLEFPSSSVRMGEIAHVKISLDPVSAQSLPVQNLKGQTLNETLYVNSVSPMLRHEGTQDYSAEAEIVFIKVPPANELQTTVSGQKIRIFWNNVRIDVLEVPKEFIFGNFEIPSPARIFMWILIILGTGIILLAFWKLKTYLDEKASRKRNVHEWKNRLQTCSKYEDVVAIWKQKRIFLQMFPHLEEPFTKFESVLFKYQFKPAQTYDEQMIVMDAYRLFLSETNGGFRGV